MEILELIEELGSLIISGCALVVAIFKKSKTKVPKTKEEIVDKAQAKYAKYIKKQCEKNGIETKGESYGEASEN